MIGKPTVVKTVRGDVFWLYPEFLMQRPYTYRGREIVARLVERKYIAQAFLSGSSLYVPVIGDDFTNQYEAGKSHRRGRFCIGCKHFAAPETKIIRKWALR